MLRTCVRRALPAAAIISKFIHIFYFEQAMLIPVLADSEQDKAEARGRAVRAIVLASSATVTLYYHCCKSMPVIMDIISYVRHISYVRVN